MNMSEAAARQLLRDSRIAYIEQDGIIEGTSVSVQPSPPNWGLDRIDQRTAQLDYQYRYAADGTGVHAYVMDTGIRITHSGFEGRASGAFSVIQDGVPPDQDCHGHGTHVAGILGGGPTGVAKGVTLHSVRVLDCFNSGSFIGYVEALDWIIANHQKPAVVNASIGGGYFQPAVDAIRNAVSQGITFVGSAGNANADACFDVPGAAPEAITVASATVDDFRAFYSSFGPCVDLFAPGDSILSLSNNDDFTVTWMSGTSMASPHVAGAAALFLQRFPTATPAEVTAAIVNATTRSAVIDAGAGTPNRLLYSAYLGDAVAPSLTLNAPTSGATLKGTVTITATAADDVEMRSVRFRLSGVEVGTDSTAPYGKTLDTTKYSNGSYVVEAIGTDAAGNTTNKSVAVLISNPSAVLNGWTSNTVGATLQGQASYKGSTFVMDAAGTDLWGTADSFQFAHRSWTGDVDVVARIDSLTSPAGASFAMAGVMLRESLATGSRHVALVISSEGKVKFRRRTQTGGTTFSDGPSAGSTYVPRWLRLSRRGNTFAAYLSDDARTWKPVHVPQSVVLPSTVKVGLIVLRSGGSGLARAAFSHVGVGRVPDGWTAIDVGPVGALGATEYATGTYVVNATGSDLWGSEDAAHFVYRPWAGDVDVVAKVESMAAPPGSQFALAGISIRETLAPNSRHASIIVTTDGKAKFRRRLTVGGSTLSDGPSAGSITIPRWVRLKRTGDNVSAYMSADGVAWQKVHTTQVVPLSAAVQVGIIGARSGGSAPAAIGIDNVTVR